MKPRVKMGQMPGDISKQEKIEMIEGKKGKTLQKWFVKNVFKPSERAVLKRQTEEEIERWSSGEYGLSR